MGVEGDVVKIFVAVGLAVGAWLADRKVKKDTGKHIWQLSGHEFWNYLNSKLRSFCDDIRAWLGENQSFGTKIIRFTVRKLDDGRAALNRVINAKAISETHGEVEITDAVLSPEEAEGLEIDDCLDLSVDELKA